MAPKTVAVFHLSHSPQEPLEINIKYPAALALVVVKRDALKNLAEEWKGANSIQ